MLLSKLKESGAWFTQQLEEPIEYLNVKFTCCWCKRSENVVARKTDNPFRPHDGKEVIEERGWKRLWFTRDHVCPECIVDHFVVALVPGRGKEWIPKNLTQITNGDVLVYLGPINE